MSRILFRRYVLAGAAVATACLAGCASLAVMSHVPLATLARLSSLKLAEINPTQVRVAARLPAALEPRRDGVKVRIDVAGRGERRAQATEFILEPASEPAEQAALAGQHKQGQRLWIYRLSATDAERLQRIITAAGAATGVTIAAGVEACYGVPFGKSPLPTTTYLRIDASDYVVLAADLDLRHVVDEHDLKGRIPPCL